MSLADELINEVETKYPRKDQPIIKNYCDVDVDGNNDYFNQYILGLVAHEDSFGIKRYMDQMEEKLGAKPGGVPFVLRRIEDIDLDGLEVEIRKISSHFGIDLKMRRWFRIREITTLNVNNYAIVLCVHRINYPKFNPWTGEDK